MDARLARFYTVAQDPLAAIRSLASGEKRPLGYFSSYFPVELARAFGYIPLRLTGFRRDTPRADASLQSYCCSLVRSSLEAALAGDLDSLEGVVFVHSCDTLQRLAAIWQLSGAHEWTDVVVFPTDLSTSAAYDFLHLEFERFAGRLASRRRLPYDRQALQAAIAAGNRDRQLARRVFAARAKGQLGLADSLAITRAATLMERDDWVRELTAVLPAFEAAPARQDGFTLYMWGGVFENLEIAQWLDERGVRVVGERLTTSGHDFQGTIETRPDEDPLTSLARYYFDRPPEATKLREGYERTVDCAEDAKRCGAQAVLFPLIKFCDPQAFDYPGLKNRLNEADLPHFHLEFDLQESGSGQTLTRLEAFLERFGA